MTKQFRRRITLVLVCCAILLFTGSLFQRTESSSGELNATTDAIQHPRPAFTTLIASLLIPLPKSSTRLLFTLAVNSAHLRLLYNWIEGFNRSFGNEFRNRFLVVALDAACYEELRRKNIPSIFIAELIPEVVLPGESEALFESADFQFLSRLKLHVVSRLLRYYRVDVLFSDVDLVITQPSLLTYLAEIPAQYDLAIADDTSDTGPESFCTCFFLVRSSSTDMIAILDKIEKTSFDWQRKKEKSYNDQDTINMVIRGQMPWIPVPSDMRNRTFLFPVNLFPNGAYMDKSPYSPTRLEYYFFHANFRKGMTLKIDFLAKHGVWYLDEKYTLWQKFREGFRKFLQFWYYMFGIL